MRCIYTALLVLATTASARVDIAIDNRHQTFKVQVQSQGRFLDDGYSLMFNATTETGTTLLGLQTVILQHYFSDLAANVTYDQSKATADIDATLPSLPTEKRDRVKSLSIIAGKENYTILPEELIAPAAEVKGGQPDRSYLLLFGFDSKDIGVILGVGKNFVAQYATVY